MARIETARQLAAQALRSPGSLRPCLGAATPESTSPESEKTHRQAQR